MATEERPTPPIRYRRLRIAWSVVWGLAAVLLCVLWVRSFWAADALRHCTPSTRYISASSEFGSIELANLPSTPAVRGWDYHRRAPLKAPWWRCVLGDFDYMSHKDSWIVTVPFWLPTIGLLTVGISPYLLWRFSLRTLLIATTLIAVVLGLCVNAMRN